MNVLTVGSPVDAGLYVVYSPNEANPDVADVSFAIWAGKSWLRRDGEEPFTLEVIGHVGPLPPTLIARALPPASFATGGYVPDWHRQLIGEQVSEYLVSADQAARIVNNPTNAAINTHLKEMPTDLHAGLLTKGVGLNLDPEYIERLKSTPIGAGLARQLNTFFGASPATSVTLATPLNSKDSQEQE